MTVSRVQFKHQYTGASATFTSSVTAGNLIVVGVSSQDGTSTDSYCNDSAGNTYTKVKQLQFVRTNLSVWYAYNVTGGTIQVNAQSGSNQDPGLTIVEYASTNGAWTTDPLDTFDFISNTVGATPQTVSLTTTAAGFIFLEWADEQVQNFSSPTTGVSLINLDTGHYDAQMDQLNTTAGSYTPGYNCVGAVSVVSSGLIGVAFKEPGGGPPPAGNTSNFLMFC